LFPTEWLLKHVISDDYAIKCPAQDIQKWREWSSNHDKSRLYCFPPPQKSEESFWGISRAEQIITKRGGTPPTEYKYKGEKFILEDYDWEEEIWSYWDAQAQLDPKFWLNIGRGIVCWYFDKWKSTISAETKQKAAKYAYDIDHDNLYSGWLMKVKSLPCLPDLYGFPMTPAELMRTTPDTGPLSSVERFIHKDLDKHEYAEVLELLGVRGKPAGIGPLLDRLQALSKAEKPPISALGSIYECIDRALLRMSTDEVLAARDRFREFKLIFTEDNTWECAPHVYLDNPEQIPGVRIINHEFRSMKLWEQLNVTTRPTFEMALAWLLERPIGEKLLEDERMRVRAIIRRDPQGIWTKTNAWLDLSGRWQEKKALKLAISRNPVPTLFDSFRRIIADFTMVQNNPFDFCEYTGLEDLDTVMEVRLEDKEDEAQSLDGRWLGTLGSLLMRLKDQDTKDARTDADSPTIHDRDIANRMRMSSLHQVRNMKAAPYIHGELAGSAKDCMVHWFDNVIYVKGPSTQHIHELKKMLANQFNTQSARAAIEDCAYREPSWIHEYAIHNLDLEEERPYSESAEGTTEAKDNSKDKKDFQEEQVDITTGSGDSASSSSDSGTSQGEQHKEHKDEQEKKRAQSRQDHLGNAFRLYMKEKGYHLDGNKYVHPDGNWITRAEHSSSFDWIEYDEKGQIVSLYWIDHGTIQEGFDIPSEIWNYQNQDGCEVYLLLIEKDVSIQKYSLSNLKHLADDGRVEVFPHALKVRMVG